MALADELKADEELDRAVASRTRYLKDQLDKASAEAAELRNLLKFYNSARYEPIKIPRWQIKPSKGTHRGLLVAQMTDWHLDEVVQPSEVLNMNAYNGAIALQRVQRWTEKVITLPRDYMHGLALEGLIIPATGDLFTGEIHAELTETNERPLLASVLHWMEPVIGVLRTFEKEYPHVAVHAVVGNHGRLSDKPVFKNRTQRNIEWLFWSIVRDRLSDLGSTVLVNVSPSMDLNVPMYERNYLLTHGDQFRGGTGISGALAPLSLGAHRKTRRQMAAQMPMKTMVMGHFHQLLNLPGVIVGGCLKGLDEYAFGLNLPPDEDGASQAMWVTSPERAMVLWMPVYVADRVLEGW